MIFNEQMLYKDRLGKVSNNVDYEVKMSNVVHLKVFPMNNLQMNVCEVQETIPPEDQENVSSKVNQYTLVTKLKRSYRPIRPPYRYSPSLNNILLIEQANQRVMKKSASWWINQVGVNHEGWGGFIDVQSKMVVGRNTKKEKSFA